MHFRVAPGRDRARLSAPIERGVSNLESPDSLGHRASEVNALIEAPLERFELHGVPVDVVEALAEVAHCRREKASAPRRATTTARDALSGRLKLPPPPLPPKPPPPPP